MDFGIGTEGFDTEQKKLQKRNSFKYLGVYFDKKLLFHDHIDHTVKKLNQFSGMIWKSSRNLSHKVRFNFLQFLCKINHLMWNMA